MIANLFKPKPANLAAWALAGGAMYAWMQYDKQKATTFSTGEVESWNDTVKSKHPKAAASAAAPADDKSASA